MKNKNIGLGKTIDMIELSDAFRRRAPYTSPEAVHDLVLEGHRFAGLSTWYGPTETFRNRALIGDLGKKVTRMAAQAAALGAESLELPVSGDRRSVFARFFNRHVLPTLDLPVNVSLQTTEYQADLAYLGPIDKRYHTAIDFGLRGMADINSELRASW